MLRIFAAGLSSLLLASCVSQPVGLTDLAPYTSAADPGTLTGGGGYKGVVGDYTHRAPASPRSWRGSGVEVAPLASPSSPASSDDSQPKAEPAP